MLFFGCSLLNPAELAEGPHSIVLLCLQVEGGHLVPFESPGGSAALIKDTSPERWPMDFFENDCIQADIHRNTKDNPTPKLKSTCIFLKGKKHLMFPYLCS